MVANPKAQSDRTSGFPPCLWRWDGDDEATSSMLGGCPHGTKQTTAWVPYGDTVAFTSFANSDSERLKFIQSLLNSVVVSIEFKPFLTRVPSNSVFDLSKLRDEMDKYPECATK